MSKKGWSKLRYHLVAAVLVTTNSSNTCFHTFPLSWSCLAVFSISDISVCPENYFSSTNPCQEHIGNRWQEVNLSWRRWYLSEFMIVKGIKRNYKCLPTDLQFFENSVVRWSVPQILWFLVHTDIPWLLPSMLPPISPDATMRFSIRTAVRDQVDAR